MEQIFRDHALYVASGLAAASVVAFIPRQGAMARKLSRALLVTAATYPCVLVLLYLVRGYLGEGYAYLVYGLLVAIASGVVGTLLLLVWLIVYFVTRRVEPITGANHGQR